MSAPVDHGVAYFLPLRLARLASDFAMSQSAAHNFENGSCTPEFSAQVDHGVASFLPLRLASDFAMSRLAAG